MNPLDDRNGLARESPVSGGLSPIEPQIYEAGGLLKAGDATAFAVDLARPTNAELLRLYSSVLDQLRFRGVVRSANNPIADYAESLAAGALGLRLAGKSATGYDAVGPDNLRYQVKARRLTQQNGSRQLSFIRGLDDAEDPFDYLVGILFEADFEIRRAALVPVAVVRQRATNLARVNAKRLMLTDSVWTLPAVKDITDQIKTVAGSSQGEGLRMGVKAEPIAKQAEPVDIDDPVLLIRIPRLHEPGMAGVELYDCTRGIWKVGVRREGAAFAFAVIGGVVLEVYAIDHWQPAGTSHYLNRTDVAVPGRWEFIGNVAPEAVRAKYVGRSVKSYLPLRFQSPVRYVNC